MFSYLDTEKYLSQTAHKAFNCLDHAEISPQRLVYDKQGKNNWPGNV